jgi:O-acetyl-ADP-ribose deacetylase (regulator of RNase III)
VPGLIVHLRDRNPEMVAAWERAFQGVAVEISCGDIAAVDGDALVSPANSFGFMDGGIDLAYSRRFGWGLQARLQERLKREHHGELPVGQALVVETGDAAIPWLISAPTMRVPMDVSETVNAYLAFRAALVAVRAHNDGGALPIRRVVCPGLGTAIGRMPPERCARQMHAAHAAVVLGQTFEPLSLGQMVDLHHALLR